jgi:hypothetical protein
MKKNILSVLFLLIICTASNAQDNTIYGGLRLSPNYSFFTSKLDKVSSGIGYSIGYFEVLELSNKINLQAEINYSNYAFVDTRITKVTETTRNTNLELPIMIKYRVADGFAIGAGYQFNLLNKQFRGQSIKTKVDGQDAETQDIEGGGVSTNGYFVDANLKTGTTLIGLRILKTKDILFEKESINVGLYLGFTIFK